jgi:hypothetical protein
MARSRLPVTGPMSVALALALLLAAGPARAAQSAIMPAFAAVPDPDTGICDADGNGIEDLLQQWQGGQVAFTDLRATATKTAEAARAAAAAAATANGADLDDTATADHAAALKAAPGPWGEGHLRLLCLDASPATQARALANAAKGGTCRALFTTERFGGVSVVEVDESGLRALLAAPPAGRLVLDRDGVPALDFSRRMVGANRLETGAWRLGDDGSFSLAILDSGCDTAHGDLGDPSDDDLDGPPPAVGDAADWYPATAGWPLLAGYKVIGWHDVTDDFPLAVGPWDYHWHGTALASVAAGSGTVAAAEKGVAPGAKLVVVKFYDFDVTWHAWAGDFLAAIDWLLDNRQALRVGPVLMAVNWDAESGIAAAVGALADAGLTPVAAMGNYGTTGAIGWPARVPKALTVGAVADDGAVAAFSGRGGYVATKPDLVAPGGGLLAASGRVDCADIEPNDSYSPRWGTSLAAAHVAGALHLLDEALGEQAVSLPRDLTDVRTRQAVLRLTAAPVDAAETADGLDRVALPAGTAPRDDRGWGLLRIDAAVQALLVPLRPGVDQSDSLLVTRQPVVARRLDLQPGVRYLVEALPSPGLDLELVIADPRALDTDPTGAAVTRLNQGGAGTSEFTYVTAEPESWRLLAVKRLSGQGAVVLRVREASGFTQQGASRVLPGALTGGPAVGTLAGFSGPSFVVPTLVASDPIARSVNVLAADGNARTGWPVFVFPHPSAQGGLNLPLVWNLDGIPGDEIVVTSTYGSVYFFAAGGSYQTVSLTLNRWLTPAVGLFDDAGQRRVLAVDQLGTARTWRAGGVAEATAALGHAGPLAPAVGKLTGGAGESIVIAFADGWVTALDSHLATLPGWPRDLGGAPATPPVLCDLDDDGRHEVIVPLLGGDPAPLVFRVLEPDGTAAVGDGAVAPAPSGGLWRGVSWPVVAGRPDTGELQVALGGLVTNDQVGAAAAWDLAEARLQPGGSVTSRALPGLHVHATSDQGVLNLDGLVLAPPVAWNHRGGWGTDLALLAHVAWSEVLYGLSSIPGLTTGWYVDTGDTDPLAVRRPTTPGGAVAGPVSALGAVLVRINADLLLRLDVQDRTATITPVADLYASSPLWAGARGDARNTGAYPLVVGSAPVAPVLAATVRLDVQPNPGGGEFRFRFAAPGGAGEPARWEVYDLRGRRVAAFGGSDATGGAGADAGAGGEVVGAAWDGRDAAGRPLPAGTYLVRARAGRVAAATRLTIVH